MHATLTDRHHELLPKADIDNPAPAHAAAFIVEHSAAAHAMSARAYDLQPRLQGSGAPSQSVSGLIGAGLYGLEALNAPQGQATAVICK